MKWPDIQTLNYWNQWSMLFYRIVAGSCMIPVALAAWRFYKGGFK